MTGLQKKLAAKMLKCGKGRIWIDPKSEKVKAAITRADLRRFIDDGVIKKFPKKKNVHDFKTSQQKRGSISGKSGARVGKKDMWLKVVRPQRKLVKELRESGKLKEENYRKIYRQIKGRMFRSKGHLMLYLKEKGYLVE
jgi:large subunit ribosomal protein L19e